jgi:hypothetical protein
MEDEMGTIRMEPKDPELRFVAIASQRKKKESVCIRCGAFTIEVRRGSDFELLKEILDVLETRTC